MPASGCLVPQTVVMKPEAVRAGQQQLPSALPEPMASALTAFGRHLGSERGLSPHTVRAYLGDISALLAFAAEEGCAEVADLDISVAKVTTIHEGLRAQFRVEYFNILNHTNFTTPNPVVFSNGPTPSKLSAAPAISPTAGAITATATSSRQLQFALKFLF